MKRINFSAIVLAAASLLAGNAMALPASSAGAGTTTIATNVCTSQNGLCAGLSVAQVQAIIDANKTPGYSPPTDLCTASNGNCAGMTAAQIQAMIDANKVTLPAGICTTSNGFCAGMTTAQVQALIDASKVLAYVPPSDLCTATNGKCAGMTDQRVKDIVGPLIPNQSKIGAWQFLLPGYPPAVFVGTGAYDSGTGKFSGEMKCSNHGCGTFGFNNCGADVSCAWQWAYGPLDITWYNGSFYNVLVTSLPVTSVTKIW